MPKTVSLNSAYYQLGVPVVKTVTMLGSAATGNRGFFPLPPFSGTVYSAVLTYVSATSAAISVLPRTQIQLITTTGSTGTAKASIVWGLSKVRGNKTALTFTAFNVKGNETLLIRHNRQGTGGAKTGAAILTVYMRPQV